MSIDDRVSTAGGVAVALGAGLALASYYLPLGALGLIGGYYAGKKGTRAIFGTKEKSQYSH